MRNRCLVVRAAGDEKFRRFVPAVLVLVCSLLLVQAGYAGEQLELSGTVVVTRPGDLPNAEKAAAVVFVEEVESRTGI